MTDTERRLHEECDRLSAEHQRVSLAAIDLSKELSETKLLLTRILNYPNLCLRQQIGAELHDLALAALSPSAGPDLFKSVAQADVGSLPRPSEAAIQGAIERGREDRAKVQSARSPSADPASDPRAMMCPGKDCPMCNGEACNLCGAGCWNRSAPRCDHDVMDRHRAPAPASEEPKAENSNRGVAGDYCEVGNECGRAGCEFCQQ